MPSANPDTPAMRQYQRFKQQHPECVLFFRMGDFYEMFFEDAKLAHKVLGVTLTQRTEGVPMAGVPYHAVEGYLRRMIQAGHRVAVCEQVEDAAQAKGVVQRDVTRIVTPGTITDDSLLDEGKENTLAAVHVDGERAHVAWAELSTGAFHVATLQIGELADELARIAPRELLMPEEDFPTAQRNGQSIDRLAEQLRCAMSRRPAWQFRLDDAINILCKQFQVTQLTGFGFAHDDGSLIPAGAIINYLLETQRTGSDVTTAATASVSTRTSLPHLQPPRRYNRADHLVIDATSLRSLEVERTLRNESTEGSLLGVFLGSGDCVTAMGKRLLRQWLCYPLCDREAIQTRQRCVAALVEDGTFLEQMRSTLDDVQDVQRIVGRMSVGRATPRDLVALGRSAGQAEKVRSLLAQRPAVAGYYTTLTAITPELTQLSELIAKACVDAPPQHLRDGGLIRDGYDASLDEYRLLQRDSNSWLAQYQKQLIEQTGINSLKVGFNKVFGFYIELTAINAGKAPDAWTRKQTLKNYERYITPELKEYEGKVLSAEHRAVAREQELFAQLCIEAQQRLSLLQQFAQVVAELDVLCCFARRAVRRQYVKPTIVDEPLLSIRAGRHPVLDELLGEKFVPNDVALGSGVLGLGSDQDERGPVSESQSSTPHTLALITGPNMAGKSTYIRQAALIVLLAHAGSFVPAEAAVVGLCDRIFTRIGASDELHMGQSTFMVEMTETANICHHATARSLVILDEIGRGTSTLDGLSLAWAIAEHLAGRGCRTLFATHYHEITQLAGQYEQVTNLNVTVREWRDEIVFLHRIVPGATDRSYGIHVAKIAGLPREVVKRANELLSQLAVSHEDTARMKPAAVPARQSGQLSLFTEYVEHPAIDELRRIDLTQLSPMQAFDLLRKLREQME